MGWFAREFLESIPEPILLLINCHLAGPFVYISLLDLRIQESAGLKVATPYVVSGRHPSYCKDIISEQLYMNHFALGSCWLLLVQPPAKLSYSVHLLKYSAVTAPGSGVPMLVRANHLGRLSQKVLMIAAGCIAWICASCISTGTIIKGLTAAALREHLRLAARDKGLRQKKPCLSEFGEFDMAPNSTKKTVQFGSTQFRSTGVSLTANASAQIYI